jgi:hypothetical protein
MAEKVTFHIDGKPIQAAKASFEVNAQRTDLGIPKMELPLIVARVWINLNDEKNCPFDTIKKLFDLSTALSKKDRIKPVKLEFWSDLKQENPTVCYMFDAWISSFTTTNVTSEGDDGHYNHYLILNLTPDTTEGRFQTVKCSN